MASLSSWVLGLVIGLMVSVLVDGSVGEQAAQAATKGAQAEIEGRIEQKTANTVDIALLIIERVKLLRRVPTHRLWVRTNAN